MADRNVLNDLEAAFSTAVDFGREAITPVVGAGRYLFQGPDKADASDARDWARENLSGLEYTPSEGGQKVKKEMFQAAGEGLGKLADADALGLRSMAESGAADKLGKWWSGLDEDTRAGADIMSGGLDLLSNALGAGFIPAIIRQGAKAKTLFHGTHADIPSFDPNMGDIGTHFGSAQQANNRLIDVGNERAGLEKWRGGKNYQEGANVMPTQVDIGNELVMDDIGTWNDSGTVAESLNKMPEFEGQFDDLIADADDIKRSFEDTQDWIDSPENREMLDELTGAIRGEGYNTVRYKNKVENQYHDDAGWKPEVQARMDEINSEYQAVTQGALARHPLPADQIKAAKDQIEVNEIMDQWGKERDQLLPEEQARLDELDAENVALSVDENKADPNSYIALDPDTQVRSMFEKDPKQGLYLEHTEKPNTYKVPGKGEVTPVNIDFRNPLVADLDQGTKKPKKWEVELAQAFDDQSIDRMALFSEKHDGVIIKRPGGEWDYMATSPGQFNDRYMDQALQDALDYTGEAEGLGAKGKYKYLDKDKGRKEGRNPDNPPGWFDDPKRHPISDSVMAMPYDDMTSTRVDTPGVNLEDLDMMQPEDMTGEWMLGSPWDRTARGQTVTHVNGLELSAPVDLEGGRGFLYDPDVGASASHKSFLTPQRNKAMATGSDDVNLVPFTMGHQSADFSTMVTDVHMGRMHGYDIDPDGIKAFDKEMIEGTGNLEGPNKPRPDWPGFNSPDVRQVLDDNPSLRLRFLKLQDKQVYKKAGFPDVASSRKAVQDMAQENIPDLFGGGAIASLDVGAPLEAVPGGHKSYGWQLPGKARGKLDKELSYRTMFADWDAKRRLVGADPKDDPRSFSMSGPVQEVTPELAQVLGVHPGYRPGGQ